MNVTSIRWLHSLRLSRDTYLFSEAPDDDDSEKEDIDGELANTGDIANRSNGKTATKQWPSPTKRNRKARMYATTTRDTR